VRTVCEQYLWKGRRVLYHVALREEEGKLELLFRWENYRSAGSRLTPCPTEERGRALLAQKVAELCRRGYEKRARIMRPAASTAVPPRTSVETRTHEVPAPTQTDGLETQLLLRRMEAAWSIE